MALELQYYGNPILRQKCSPIPSITKEIKDLANEMISLLEPWQGVGLAAPQVGKALRLFVACNYVEKEGEWVIENPTVYINPKIIAVSSETVSDVEGCLSIPGVRAKVERPEMILIEALDLDGNVFREELHGYNARIRLHENDHINGVLFIDRLSKEERKALNKKLNAIKKRA